MQVGVPHGGRQAPGAPQQLLRMHLSPEGHSADVVQEVMVLHSAAPTQAGVPSVVVTQRQALPQELAWQLSPVTEHVAASVVVVVVEAVVVVVAPSSHGSIVSQSMQIAVAHVPAPSAPQSLTHSAL